MTESGLVAPWNVGVAPTTVPDESASVKLWPSGVPLLKLMVAAPALAVSEAGLNLSSAPGPAATARVCGALVPPLAGVVVAGAVAAVCVAGVAGARAGVLAVELVLLEELPHPARASTASASGGADSLNGLRCSLTV